MSNPQRPSSRPNPPTPSAEKPHPARVATKMTGGVPQNLSGQPLAATRRPDAAAFASRGGAGFFDKPLLSTIDQYVLSSFVKNYLISLFVLIGMYVVLDMVFNFDEFVKVSGHDTADTDTVSALSTVITIVDFYFFQSFRVFNHLAGIIPVVATAFTLVRMSRFNELAALLSAGVPLLRVAQPIILAAALVNGGLLMVNQEIIVPSMIDQLTRARGDTGSELERNALEAMPVGPHSLLFASKYTMPRDAQPATIDGLHVLEKTSEETTTQLAAEHAVYDPAAQSWHLTNGTLTTISRADGPQTAPVTVDTYDGSGAGSSKGSVNPETIGLFVSRGDFVDLLSTQRIKQLLEQRTTVGQIDLMRVRDSRWANYVLNVVLVALTIPCVLTREPTQLRTAATRVFVLIGTCMATIFITQSLAGQPPSDPNLAARWPAIMAWLPIFMFMPVAIWLLDRLKT